MIYYLLKRDLRRYFIYGREYFVGLMEIKLIQLQACLRFPYLLLLPKWICARSLIRAY
jgi:hypothetical protein